ncbi:MAG: hypothetical protein IT233_12435 [Bacteroidia bacterium]|nr:hypothetical protein [Bacteroidia bacterium]
MAIYKFRVVFEDQDDVSRDLEAKGSTSFRELADCILRSVAFDDKHSGSFFISDDSWRYGEEFVWKEEDRQTGYAGKKRESPLRLMEKAKVVSYIDDPHQKFIFIYDYKELWTFHIEMTRIVSEEPGAVYPRVTRTIGTPPKQYKQVLPATPEEGGDLLSKLSAELSDEEDEPMPEQIAAAEEGMDEEDHERAAGMSEEKNEEEENEGGEDGDESSGSYDAEEEDH